MNNTAAISCVVGTTDPAAALGLEIWVDNLILLDIDHVTDDSMPVTYDINDADGEHELIFVLKHKTDKHTQIDSQGNIIHDARLTINNLKFNDMELGQLLHELAVYTHDLNGTGAIVQDKFYSEMGCNGTVSIKFTTPIYQWLLDNL